MSTKQGVPVERFMEFIVTEGHDAEHLTNNVISILKQLKISILNCRGESYDNASNMAGNIQEFKPESEISIHLHTLFLILLIH